MMRREVAANRIRASLVELYAALGSGLQEQRAILEPLLAATKSAAATAAAPAVLSQTAASSAFFISSLSNGLALADSMGTSPAAPESAQKLESALKQLLWTLSEGAEHISWWQNPNYRDTMPTAFLDSYSSTLLVGPSGSKAPILHAEDIKIGLFLLGPDQDYPYVLLHAPCPLLPLFEGSICLLFPLIANFTTLVSIYPATPLLLRRAHHHPAAEAYVVLSGKECLWRQSRSPFQARRPGDFIYHCENEVHAMRTAREPLLALWAWTGDITTNARWCKPPPRRQTSEKNEDEHTARSRL